VGASGTEICLLSFIAGLASLNLSDCNVRTANDTSLIPTLLKDAAIKTNKPLLIRIIANVSLGAGLNQPIQIRRPVMLLGMTSALVSVDLGMAVNTLNVTAPGAQLSWQGVVLENLAPGE
jgi:hypothetical protein